MPRIAIIDKDKCKPDKCKFLCHKVCPIVMSGSNECIQLVNNKAKIDETLCTGCGICPKKCPYKAIQIINLPEITNKPPIHQYGENGFRIFNLPIIQEKSITGIIGRNGIGKSTVINILSEIIYANFGKIKENNKIDRELYFQKLKDFFKGSVLQNYFEKLYNKEIKVSYKPQQILKISENFNGKVKNLLLNVNSEEKINEISEKLYIKEILERDIKKLSGGELQRVAIAATLLKEDSNFYVLDEISNFLDVFQRLNTSKIILEKIKDKTGLVVEHDLIVLDYLTDYIHIQYGEPGAYGILTGLKSSKKGINDYLEGYCKEENVKFRDKPIVFTKDSVKEDFKKNILTEWEDFNINKGEFKLNVEKGNIKEGEVIGIIGRNGLGKSTMIDFIAKNGFKEELNISYKPQLIPTSSNTVLEELVQFENFTNNFYKIYILEPLRIEDIIEKKINQLSGGELQRYAIAKALLQDADIYLFDEPTAFLDIEDRLKISKVITSFIETKKKSAMIIDHDLIFIDYLSDRLLIFNGIPGREGRALKPLTMKKGMNLFLKDLGITFRRDENNKRPRVNKENSVKDVEQKRKGEYYYV